MEKDSFLLSIKYQDMFNLLNDSQAGRLIKSIFEYEKTGKEPKLYGQVNMAFLVIKHDLDENRKKYLAKCVKNRENGSLGGRPRKSFGKNNDLEKPNGIFDNQEKTKKADNDNDNDNDNDIYLYENIEKKIKEKKYRVDAKKFFDYYSASNWKDKDGYKVNVEQKLMFWDSNNKDALLKYENLTESDEIEEVYEN